MPEIILGFVLGIFASLIANTVSKYRNRKRIYYFSKNRVLYNSDAELIRNTEIKATCNDVASENISINLFSIWNSGETAIENKDFKSDLKIVSRNENIKIQQVVSEIRTSVTPMSYQIENNNSIKVDLEHLDKFEGDLLKIVYLGKGRPNFDLVGSVKYNGRISRVNILLNVDYAFRNFHHLFKDLGLYKSNKYPLLVLFLPITSLINYVIDFNLSSNFSDIAVSIVYFFVVAIYFVFGLAFTFKYLYSFHRIFPDEIREYYRKHLPLFIGENKRDPYY